MALECHLIMRLNGGDTKQLPHLNGSYRAADTTCGERERQKKREKEREREREVKRPGEERQQGGRRGRGGVAAM